MSKNSCSVPYSRIHIAVIPVHTSLPEWHYARRFSPSKYSPSLFCYTLLQCFVSLQAPNPGFLTSWISTKPHQRVKKPFTLLLHFQFRLSSQLAQALSNTILEEFGILCSVHIRCLLDDACPVTHRPTLYILFSIYSCQ